MKCASHEADHYAIFHGHFLPSAPSVSDLPSYNVSVNPDLRSSVILPSPIMTLCKQAEISAVQSESFTRLKREFVFLAAGAAEWMAEQLQLQVSTS